MRVHPEVEMLGRSMPMSSCRTATCCVNVKIRLVRSKNAFELMAACADAGFKILLTVTFLHV